MERKVARAQGEYRADEKEVLNAKVDQLEKLLTVCTCVYMYVRAGICRCV
jgi:hypothetical protein